MRRIAMAKEYSRAEFHELVWSKPITRLAKEFGLSDVAVHKICRKNDVPTPPAGWWAKKAAGKVVTITPLPAPENETRVRIVATDLGLGDPRLAVIREAARVRASSAPVTSEPHPIIEKTIARLRKATPPKGEALISTSGPGLITCSIGPGSVDRLDAILTNLLAATTAQGFSLVATENGAGFKAEGNYLGFSITEVVARTKHVLTEAEAAKLEAWEKKQEARRRRDPWSALSFDRPRFPEWDYACTGRLRLEFEAVYLQGGPSPRRSFSDAKIQRLENMSGEIAVGLVVLAAAKSEEERRREAQRRAYEEERRRRQETLRAKHIAERRASALEEILAELGHLRHFRTLLNDLERTGTTHDTARVAEFLRWAHGELSRREAALTPPGLEERFGAARLFGGDDDHDFRAPYYS
jgi:hypothetical protein